MSFNPSQPTPYSDQPSSSSSQFRHQRQHSTTSQTSSHSFNHPILASPALSFTSVPNHQHHQQQQQQQQQQPQPHHHHHDSAYVDEPLQMEGEFASLDLQHSSSNQSLNHFLQSQQNPHSSNSNDQYPQRYDTLTWAREHALPELRQETMLATGGLHPKTSVSSITTFLDHQTTSHPQHLNFAQSNPSTDLSISASSSPSLASRTSFSIHDLNTRPISPSHVNNLSSPFLNSSECPSPALSAFGTNDLSIDSSNASSTSSNIPSININESNLAPINNPSNPNPSPHLRLDMNHPAMSNGPTISLTSATPLTAKPNQSVDVPNFQRFLDQLSQPEPNQNNLNLNHSSPPDPSSQTQSTSFQAGFEEMLSNHPHHLDFLQLDQSSSFLSTRTNKGRQRSKSESVANSIQIDSNPTSFLSSNYNSYSQTNPNPIHSSDPLQNEPQGSDPSHPTFLSTSSQAFPSTQFNLLPQSPNFPSTSTTSTFEDMNLGLDTRNRMESRSYENRYLSTNLSGSTSTTPHLIQPSHPTHRRGRSESQIMNQFNFNLSKELSTHEEWEDILKHSNPRERSYSRSSIGSSIQSKSYQINSRTTPATKAAAAKRRKEGNEARYVCEMCGEGFTRRYNLRGHQRAHKGEKPFVCGFPGCTSSFARAHDQKRHYKLHLGIKDYNCKVCGKAFIRLDALQRHHKSDAGQGCFYELKSKGELSYEHDSSSQSQPQSQSQSQFQPSSSSQSHLVQDDQLDLNGTLQMEF